MRCNIPTRTLLEATAKKKKRKRQVIDHKAVRKHSRDAQGGVPLAEHFHTHLLRRHEWSNIKRTTWYNSICGDCTHWYCRQHCLQRDRVPLVQLEWFFLVALWWAFSRRQKGGKYLHSSNIQRQWRGPAAPQQFPPPRSSAGRGWPQRCSGGKEGRRPWRFPSVETEWRHNRRSMSDVIDMPVFKSRLKAQLFCAACNV